MASEIFITDFNTMRAALDFAVNGKTKINYTGVPPQPRDRAEAEEWKQLSYGEKYIKALNEVSKD